MYTDGKETGENGAGTDGKDKKPESGSGEGRPADGRAGRGSGAGLIQPGTGGRGHAAGEKAAGENGKGADTDTDKRPETPEEGGKQDETEESRNAEESGRADDAVKGWEYPGRYRFLFFLISGFVSAAAVCAWLYLRVFRKSRIRGTVLDADGNPVSGVHVSLDGEDTLETCTDRHGAFCFDGLKKGIRQLEVSRGSEKALLSMNICVGGRNKEETFRITGSNCLHVNHMRKKNDYVVDVRL